MKGKDSSRNDFMTIKEFSAFSGVSESALRRYDRIGLFHPAVRGKGKKINYRYYLPTQITTLKVILVLKNIGIPLEKITSLAKARTPKELRQILFTRECEMLDFLRSFSISLSVVGVYSSNLDKATKINPAEIYRCAEPEKPINMGGENNYSNGASPWQEFTRFCRSERNPELILSFPIGGYFDSMDSFLKAPSQPMRFFSCDPNGKELTEAGLYLTGYNKGNYGETGDLPERLQTYAKKHHYEFAGPVYNRYLTDEISIVDSSQYLLEVSVLVKEKRLTPYQEQRFKY